MLLERCRIEEVGKLFQDQSMKYVLQVKYDGERSQIHMKDGRFKYFTRNSYDITKNTLYGESINSGKNIHFFLLVRDLIIDNFFIDNSNFLSFIQMDF